MSRVIAVEGLGKKYIIKHQQKENYTALRDVIARKAINLGQKILQPFARSKAFQNDNPGIEEFWAIKDISFEINQGDRVGIIGRNGAGKSTLLKLLSRITEPTTGRITINGRVASLLEVGTGFHPELTGRENVFLNGAVLGMGKAEIKKKFDDIVAFAEIEKFLDTPVKRYSSGMYVRLAFAVAAHLEPEILIVDEVLAVGDAAFQKKCLGKMGDIAQNEGRTVLFVSHNMGAVNSLCEKAILFDKGSIVKTGDVSSVTATYFSNSISQEGNEFKRGYNVNSQILNKQANKGIKITNIELVNPKSPDSIICTGESLLIKIDYKSSQQWLSPAFVVSFKEIYGQEIIRLSTMPISGYEINSIYSNAYVNLLIDSLPLVAGRYYIDIGFVRESVEWILKLENIVELEVQPKDVYGSGLLLDRSRGLLVVKHKWEHKKSEIR